MTVSPTATRVWRTDLVAEHVGHQRAAHPDDAHAPGLDHYALTCRDEMQVDQTGLIISWVPLVTTVRTDRAA